MVTEKEVVERRQQADSYNRYYPWFVGSVVSRTIQIMDRAAIILHLQLSIHPYDSIIIIREYFFATARHTVSIKSNQWA
jgi:hypothetical protein